MFRQGVGGSPDWGSNGGGGWLRRDDREKRAEKASPLSMVDGAMSRRICAVA